MAVINWLEILCFLQRAAKAAGQAEAAIAAAEQDAEAAKQAAKVAQEHAASVKQESERACAGLAEELASLEKRREALLISIKVSLLTL